MYLRSIRATYSKRGNGVARWWRTSRNWFHHPSGTTPSRTAARKRGRRSHPNYPVGLNQAGNLCNFVRGKFASLDYVSAGKERRAFPESFDLDARVCACARARA